ncbi:hypothetical protein [Sphingomonas jatrophae]|uniref:Phasin protein n=1 Tax=Sphingomonas jatrophae TaxID=1166337 RepID=A0A1I6K3S0_9SPHN|nr:hypothetical protein [Sphingomonas jatrophae]SFR85869.1 hypothetical protein SAMN05192580_1297 [Sphingomonas jatrophae]
MMRAWENMAAAWTGSVSLAETMAASGEVIAARTLKIGRALADPLNGDWRELNRMMPEKLVAMGEAQAAMALDLARLHADSLRVWATICGMAAAGRPPTLRQAGALLSRMAAGQARAAHIGERALAPARRRVTANARRLRG